MTGAPATREPVAGETPAERMPMASPATAYPGDGFDTASEAFTSGLARQARKVRIVLGGLVGLLVAGALLSVAIGAVPLSPGQVLGILASRLGIDLASLTGSTAFTFDGQQESVLLAIRLPRVLLSVVVGAGLAVSGAVMQGLFRNPLADPGLIGVSSGSALGAAIAIVMGASASGPLADVFGPAAVAACAFIGGLLTTVVVYRVASRRGRTSVTTMLLAGIAVNALCGAAVGSLVLFANDGQLRDLTFWTLGSLGGATWGALAIATPLVGIVLVAAPWLARSLDALLLGEAEARHLGVRTDRVMRIAVTLAALAVAASTAVAGLIGFVGLVAPHLVRLLLGPGHRTLLPGTALVGAVLLLGSDLVGRTVLAPIEVPIGVVTAFAGAPFFLWLLLREQTD